jgi:hypothetical protein
VQAAHDPVDAARQATGFTTAERLFDVVQRQPRPWAINPPILADVAEAGACGARGTRR